MNIEEIKARYSMKDILARCGVKVDRHDFCTCPFHKGDHTASMKVYDKSFYCFGCCKGGDIIQFVRLYHNLDFKEACEWISGERLTRRTKEQMAIAEIKRKEEEKKKVRLRRELDIVNKDFSNLWNIILTAEPLTEEWGNAYNKWQYLCYKQEQLLLDLGAT